MTSVSSPLQPAPASTSFRPVSPWQKILGFRLLWPLLALLLLLTYNYFFTANFFRVNMINGHLNGYLPASVLGNAVPYAIVAIGMTLVIATGGVDLSVGSVMAVSAAVAAVLIVPPTENAAVVSGYGWGFWPAAGVALLTAMAIGAVNGVLVAILRIQPIIATLILMVAARGVAQLITGGQRATFENLTYVGIGNGHFAYLPLGVTIVLVMLLICAATTRLTGLGLALESVGDSASASRYVGLRVKVITIAAYLVSALCAAVAGLINASKTKTASPSDDGISMELYAIFAVVVGGTALAGGRFTLLGSVLGALLLQTLTTTLLATKIGGKDVSPNLLPLPTSLVIIAVCLLQSSKFRAVVAKPFRSLGNKRAA